MSPDALPPNAPEATDSPSLVSDISQRDPFQGRRTSTANSANEESVVTVLAHEALATTMDNVEQTNGQRALQFSPASPIRRLPNEVLQLILVEVHAQSTEKERQNPITAQVCMCWRQLAQATPSLWTSINVKLNAEDQEVIHEVAQMKTRIERAKQRLVAVKLYTKESFNYSPPGQNTHLFDFIVTTLLQYRDRIASLRLPCQEGLGGHLATKCATETITFDNLHTLFLDQDQYRHSPKIFDAKPLFKACPNLRRLRMKECQDISGIHWEKIKLFTGHLGTADLSAFTTRAQIIEEAEIRSMSWSSLPNITFGNHLTALSLINLHPDCASSLASTPRPPSLRYLSIGGTFCCHRPILDTWAPGLEFLGVSSAITASHFKDPLPTLSTLQGLRLRGHEPIPPNFFSLLPKLTHLEIHSGVRSRAEEDVRGLLSSLLEPAPSTEHLSIRSIVFLPGSRHFSEPLERVYGYEKVWADLFQALEAIGIRVHEYRTNELFHTPVFSTPFFDERGWCV